MSILYLKWIKETDPELKDLRSRFGNEYSDVEICEVCPDRGSAFNYSAYYIQIKPKEFPPKIHFEYWADKSQGFLDLHLEPNRENQEEMKTYRGIGIHLMHVLSEMGIKCSSRWGLPYGCFRIPGIYTVDDIIRVFAYFYSAVKQPLLEIYKAKRGVSTLQLNYPDREIEYAHLRNEDEEVSVRIMTLSEVMDLNLILPPYQRDYCWEGHNISELWHSLIKVSDGNPFHLGTIILHDYDRSYGIIDGQQRLISIILRALGYDSDFLQGKSNGKFLPLLKESYDSIDAQEHVANCKYLIRSLVGKEKNIAGLASRLAENVTFAVLTVNEENLELAYTFFSNQNSKGVPLSDFDLLKAHHLRYIPNDGQAEHVAKKWNNLMMLPAVYKEKNALYRTLGTHIYRLRKWMRKHESGEGYGHYIQREYQSAKTLDDIPPFGERFDFYEKIQGGTHFFVYAESFVHRYQDFLRNPEVIALQNELGWGSYERYADAIETVLFGYYLKFGNQYLAEALYCIAQLAALYRYNTYRDASDGSAFRSFLNMDTELVLMIDQASSPTFFLAEALAKYIKLSQTERFPIFSGMDLPEISGVKWEMYRSMQRMAHMLMPVISERIIANKILEEYGN